MSDRKNQKPDAFQDSKSDQEQLQKIIGLGRFSARKSYYPELQKKIKELKEEKDKYESIFSGALNGIFQAEFNGRIIVANAAMVKLCGYKSQEELIAISNIGDQLFADQEENGQLAKRLYREQSVIGFETQFKRKDGTLIDISLNASIRTSQDRKYLECFVQDISDRKKVEKELKKAQNNITNIIDSMPSVLIGIDTAGRVTHWNRTISESTGISAVDAHGKPLAEVLPQMATEMNKITESMKTKTPKYYQKQRQVPETGICFEDITIYPLVTNGINGAVIRIDDVTDRVRIDEMMVQSEKMLSVGGLAAGMAHEINNPLAGMMQTADLVNRRLTDIRIPANISAAKEIGIDLNDVSVYMKKRGILKMLKTINESGRRMSGIVNNMLSFARQSDAQTSSHALSELFDKTLELAVTDFDLKKHYDFKMIEIKKEYDDNVPMIPCESGKIQQVLFNILRNGAQAMQEAAIEKPVFVIRTKFDKNLKMVSMEIEDNGPGMKETIRKRVFEPFYTTKPIGVGTGLGLSVSYFIITENHGGIMSVESTPGAGAKFIIRLPLKGKNIYK